ncbi:MAG: pilus (MSHA type) biogenesis protein MshL [Burkholderiales bacterium]|jgi:general secretion pathway protein D|nr:pilus (MSHA type) biogenesis protein MshL [Burkholderiales bacterium]
MRKNSLCAGAHLVPKASLKALASGIVIAFLLSGCGTYRSFEALKTSEPIPVTGMNEAVIGESEKLTANHDALQKKLERIATFEIAAKPIPPRYDPLENKIVNINMYDTDIGKLLWTLADQLGLNLIVDPQVLQQKTKTSLYLRNVTAREVYNHILEAFDLHGDIRNGALVISALEERIFNAGFLNTNLSIDVSAGGDVFGSNTSSSRGSGTSGGGGDALRADFSVKGNTSKQIDPYDELERAVRQILGKADGRVDDSRQQQIPKIASALDAEGKVVQKELAPEIPVFYSLNRLTGTLYVKARPSQMRSIDRLIERNRHILRRQVQVEAQLIDVQLNDGYRFGVDWTLLRKHVAGIYGANPLLLQEGASLFPVHTLPERIINIPAQIIGQPAGNRGMGLSYGDDRFSATLNALSSFGELRVLSNPSVRVRNGTPALLSVGTNIRYISKTSSTIYVPGGGSTTTSADVQTDALFSGVVVGVIPYIHDNGRIELLIHPMQTEVLPESLRLIEVGGGSYVTLPMINYKGLTTTLNLGDGDMVMIGGLIDQSKSSDKNGLPGLNDIPLLGNIFGDENKSHKSRELVVVLRVRMI